MEKWNKIYGSDAKSPQGPVKVVISARTASGLIAITHASGGR